MTSEQKSLVKQTWEQLAPIADSVTRLFYDRLFEMDPTTRPLFESHGLAEQRQKLVQALSMVVQGLDHQEALVPTLARMGARHVQYGVTAAHYDTVGSSLLWTLERALGAAWTPQVKAAWSAAYGLLAGAMLGAAAKPGSTL